MKNSILNLIRKVRAPLVRAFSPASRYWLATKSTKPISGKFGYDRGKPIDRFWIEAFLERNKDHIKGRVLEVTDNAYTKRFGKKVTKSDVLDINPKNKNANIHGDLRNLKNINSASYDTIILTHVLGLVDDAPAAISEVYRILKPGGKLLLTSSCLGPVLGEKVYWRFTANSISYMFGKYFAKKNMEVKTFGNVLAGQAFWVGMAQEDISVKDLQYNDPRYPCIVTLKATK